MTMIKKKRSQPRSRFKQRDALPSSTTGLIGEIAGAQKPSPGKFDNRTAGELDQENQFVSRVHRWFFIANDDSRDWRENHIENLKFVSNDQWSDADKAKYKRQHRPVIVINRASSIIFTVSGLQRRARQDIDLLPNDPEDAPAAEIMEILVKAIREENHIRQVSSRVFDKKLISGLGFWKLSYDYRYRPQGQIKVEERDPLHIFVDPNYPECAWEDVEWVMDAQWLSMDECLNDWPEFEERIRAKYGEWLTPLGQESGRMAGDPKSSKRSFWDAQTQRIRMLQVWYKTFKVKKIAVFKDGTVEDNLDRVAELEKVAEELNDASNHFVVIRRPVQEIRVAHVFDDILFDDMKSPLPFNELPFVPALGYYYWKHPFGLMDLMKDAQKEKNKRRAAITEIAGRTALSGFFNKNVGGADKTELEDYAHGAGVNIGYDDTVPTPIRPPQLPEILVELENKADNEIKEVVNVNDELLGQTSQTTVSGRAIEARQQGGLITQEPLFDTFQDEEAYLTELMIEMIKDNITEEEAIRYLGSKVRPKNPDPEDPTQQLFADPELLRNTLSKAFNTKYKVTITTKPYAATHAMWKANALSQLDERKPGIVPPDIFIEAFTDAGIIDKANGEKMLNRMKQMEAQQAQQAGQPPAGKGAPQPMSGVNIPPEIAAAATRGVA